MIQNFFTGISIYIRINKSVSSLVLLRRCAIVVKWIVRERIMVTSDEADVGQLSCFGASPYYTNLLSGEAKVR